MNSSPSMAAIAKAANVAKSTVSLALRNDPRVSLDVREHIQRVAKEMGYKSNALVARLMYELRTAHKQKHIGTLAFVNVHRLAELRRISSHVNHWLLGAERQAERLGYNVDHFWLNDPELPVERLSGIFYARNVQGVIFYGLLDERCLQGCESIWGRFPSVTIGSRLRKPALHFVSNDHYFTAVQACEQLISRGYSRIGLILERSLDNILEHRLVAGYRESCVKQESRFPVLYFDNTREFPRTEGKRKFVEWLDSYHPDACVCSNSFILDWIKELSIKIPDDMGVVFLDLANISKELKGKIAGMEQQPEWTGMTATDMIIGQILRREAGIPPFQRGVLIESQWCSGPTVRENVASLADSTTPDAGKTVKDKMA